MFLADFIILDFEVDDDIYILLERPFLANGRTLIDFYKRELTVRVNDQQLKFNLPRAMVFLDESFEEVLMNKIVDHLVHNYVNEYNQVFKIEHLEDLDLIEVELTEEIEPEPPRFWIRRYESLDLTSDNLKTHLPSIEETPNLEPKQLPIYLKYVYLGENDIMPVIISSLFDFT